MQKYSPASSSSTSWISRLTRPVCSVPSHFMRWLFVWWSVVSGPLNFPSLTVNRGSSCSERSRYQVISYLCVMLQSRETLWPTGTTWVELWTGEAEARWHPAAPEEWAQVRTACSRRLLHITENTTGHTPQLDRAHSSCFMVFHREIISPLILLSLLHMLTMSQAEGRHGNCCDCCAHPQL